jgi:tetratricopeptide (TPR) repeat protein
MDEQVQRIEVAAKKSWGIIVAWIGGISALIGFIGTLGGGVSWFRTHHRHSSEYKAKMSLAQIQTGQKQYQAALATYEEILRQDSLNQSALDAELDTAMLWAENFSVFVKEGKDEGEVSGPALDELFAVLTSGLTRVRGTRSADVQAHLGWLHFLNQKIAHREDDSVAVNNWHQALSTDPNNVYAHAMLGNWMLQSGSNLNEANGHLHSAVATGRALPFVRELQIRGLLHLEVPGARAEIMRVANQMRVAHESLESGMQTRVASWCFDPVVTDHQELVETLSAVPFDGAWATYLWLAGTHDGSDETQNLKQRFIRANLLEISGRRDAALVEYRWIYEKLHSRPGSLRDQAGAGIKRLDRT